MKALRCEVQSPSVVSGVDEACTHLTYTVWLPAGMLTASDAIVQQSGQGLSADASKRGGEQAGGQWGAHSSRMTTLSS